MEETPPVEAVVVDPGDTVVDLGPLSPPERVELEAELDQQATPVPSGAPQAGYGGESTANGPNTDWALAGVVLLVLAALATLTTLTLWRFRRRT